MIPTRPIREARPGPGAAIGLGRAPGSPAPPVGRFRKSEAVRLFEEPEALLEALETREVAAALRGTLPAEPVVRALARRAIGELLERAVLLEPKAGQGVLFGPVGIAEGRGAPARARFAAEAAQALERAGLLTEPPLIAVLSYGRTEDARRGHAIARSLSEGAHVAARLRKGGLDAFSAGVQIEDVIGDADIVVAPDGASGNLTFRALTLVGGMRSYGALVLGFPQPFVDTSRSRASFEDPLRLAAYLARRTQAK